MGRSESRNVPDRSWMLTTILICSHNSGIQTSSVTWTTDYQDFFVNVLTVRKTQKTVRTADTAVAVAVAIDSMEPRWSRSRSRSRERSRRRHRSPHSRHRGRERTPPRSRSRSRSRDRRRERRRQRTSSRSIRRLQQLDIHCFFKVCPFIN